MSMRRTTTSPGWTGNRCAGNGDMVDFVRKPLRLRRERPAPQRLRFLQGEGTDPGDGASRTCIGWGPGTARSIGTMPWSSDAWDSRWTAPSPPATAPAAAITAFSWLFNADAEARPSHLRPPGLEEGRLGRRVVDTSSPPGEDISEGDAENPRSGDVLPGGVRGAASSSVREPQGRLMPAALSPRVLFSCSRRALRNGATTRPRALAAALSYYTIFSISPLMVIAISVSGLVFGQEAASNQIFQQIRGFVGDAGAQAIQGLVENANRKGAGIVGTSSASPPCSWAPPEPLASSRTRSTPSGRSSRSRARALEFLPHPLPLLFHGAGHRLHAAGIPGA